MTNTAHANCSHATTKTARARCRRERGAAYNTALAARRTASDPRLVLEMCSCQGPAENTICTLCDRPQDVMTQLGALLVA